MKFTEISNTKLTEAFDKPYPYKWDSTHDQYAEFGNDSFLAKSEMDMGELMVMFTLGKPGVSWTIDFAVDGAMDKTGDGDQFRIFATVVAVIKDWMANKVDLSKVTQIDFSSDKDGAAEDSRSKLYKRFGQQLASKLGWNLEITDRGQFASFKIKNPNAPVEITESLNNPYPFKLTGPDESQSFVATANTPNGPLTMGFSSTDFDDFGIDFSIGKSMGKTDAGDEFRVFATVVAMMKKWISTVGIEHVEGFDFGANKDEHASDGRARLYTRFAKQLASQLGWKLEQSTTANGSTAFFRLTNPNPVLRDDEYWDALEENFVDGKKKVYNESNPFTDARMNAIKAGKTSFKVGGKTYKVTGDTSDELNAQTENFADGKVKGKSRPGRVKSAEVKISDLTISDAGMAIAQSAGGGSRTDAPLTVTKLPSGHVYLVNGYHRLIDAMKSGKDTVAVEYVPYEKVEILWKQEREDDIKYGKQFNEAEDTLTLPKIKVGDEVLVGKFKNRKAEVKGFAKDDHNQPVLKTTKGDQKLFKPRISKLMKTEAVNENVSALASELEQKYNLKSLFLGDMASRNAIELHSIIVNKGEQGQGTGSKVMQELIAYADANEKIMVLDPGLLDKQHGTTSQSRLRKFYKQFGFIDNKGRNKNYEFRNLMIRYPQSNESVNEGYKLQLERDTDMMVLNITDTTSGKRTEVRGKAGYETNGYDKNDKLHQLLDKISKTANISELMNGEVVGINPKHPDGASAKSATDTAFNENFKRQKQMRIREIIREAYEIEFVCVNPSFCDATDQKDQDALFNALKSVPGIIVYRQDFDVHNSMAAIIQDESNTDIPKKIQQLAKQHGVGIDLENDVSQDMIDDIVTGRLEGLIDYYDTTVKENFADGKVKGKSRRAKAFNEAKDGLPVKTLKGLYHVGTLDASKKRDGYEGAGLSVSTHPDAWKQIARGHVTGDTHSATKEGNKFLNAHSLSAAHKKQIKQWAIENGYLAQQETVTVCYYDDEMEDDLCSTFNSMADAEAEYDEELEHMDVTVDKGGIVPTDKLKKETRQNRIESTGVLEFVLPIFAEQQGLDGVWWQDRLDVHRYSAPRGVIVPSKIKSWKFAVNETAGVGRVVKGVNTTVDVGLDEIIKQVKKFGNDVNRDGIPTKNLRTK